MAYTTYWSDFLKKSQSFKKNRIMIPFDKQLNIYSWAAYIKYLNTTQCKPKSSPK